MFYIFYKYWSMLFFCVTIIKGANKINLICRFSFIESGESILEIICYNYDVFELII